MGETAKERAPPIPVAQSSPEYPGLQVQTHSFVEPLTTPPLPLHGIVIRSAGDPALHLAEEQNNAFVLSPE